MTEQEKYQDYLKMLRKPFHKLCRLRFLQPDGSVAFSVDNNEKNAHASAFISDGTISGNWQNGHRRSATVTLSNVDGAFDYNVNTVWFGTEIALDEGITLSNGEDYYIQQGVFLIENPQDAVTPEKKTITYNLVDKVANLDGSLAGNLDATYTCDVGTNIFAPIAALLAEDRGNGQPIDRVTPIFTNYYNNKTQTLPDGTTVSMTDTPYTLNVGADGTKWKVIEEFAAMLNAMVGYDVTGAFRFDPSQDDVLDIEKPVLWDFSMEKTTFLGATYESKNTEVYNDYIVVGELLDNYAQPQARARILDPLSNVNIQTIGLKTKRVPMAGFGTDKQCEDYAVWMLKRSAVLHSAVSISCSQVLHPLENNLITIRRTDKSGSPIERHLVQGFSRPLASTGEMTISATSVLDYPNAQVCRDIVNPLNVENFSLGEKVWFTEYPTIVWNVDHIDGEYVYLGLYRYTTEVSEDETYIVWKSATSSLSVYSGSNIAHMCEEFLGKIPLVEEYLESVTVEGVTSKVFAPTCYQVFGVTGYGDESGPVFDYLSASASNRVNSFEAIETDWAWTSSEGSGEYLVCAIDDNGELFTTLTTSSACGFRPEIKVHYKGKRFVPA